MSEEETIAFARSTLAMMAENNLRGGRDIDLRVTHLSRALVAEADAHAAAQARIYVLESELALERGRVQGMRDAAAIIHKNPSYLDEMIALLEAKPDAVGPTVEFTAEMVAALISSED